MWKEKTAVHLVCADNQVYVDGICLNKAHVGDACINGAQCPEGGLCEDGRCVCEDGFREENNRCLRSTLFLIKLCGFYYIFVFSLL